jgi:hypothetical protein
VTAYYLGHAAEQISDARCKLSNIGGGQIFLQAELQGGRIVPYRAAENSAGFSELDSEIE